jgi:hypothetical protein
VLSHPTTHGIVAGSLAKAPQDVQKIDQAQPDKSATDVGPENQALKDSNPNTFMPPPTDRGEVQTFWHDKKGIFPFSIAEFFDQGHGRLRSDRANIRCIS